jgi:hypothetical protein
MWGREVEKFVHVGGPVVHTAGVDHGSSTCPSFGRRLGGGDFARGGHIGSAYGSHERLIGARLKSGTLGLDTFVGDCNPERGCFGDHGSVYG